MSGVLAPIGLGLQVGGQISSGISARAAGNRNAALAEMEALAIRRDGAAEASRVRDEARRLAGEAIVAQGASGLALGTGSAMDALRENAIEAELDRLTLLNNAEARARARELEAVNSRAEGRAAMLQAILGAGATVVQGAASNGFAPRVPKVSGGGYRGGGSGASSGVAQIGASRYGTRTVR